MSLPQKQVLVLGAGVTGLTSALLLAENGYNVTVVAAHVPGDSSIEYTSPWAGGHWRPHSTPSEPELCDWDIQSYKHWLKVIEGEKSSTLPKSGLKLFDSYHFWDGPTNEEIWWAPHVLEFRQLSETISPISDINEQTTKGNPLIHEGFVCKAMAINVPQYLLYLQQEARTAGVEIIKARLPDKSSFLAAIVAAERLARESGRGDVDCYVNCTGLGASKLCNDKDMYPIRGQTVLVKGEAHATRTRIGKDYTAYCIPRPGSNSTILGGTKEVGVWDETPSEETTKTILERASWQVPELLTGKDGGFEVISVQCGLRPGRKGGPRMEREIVGNRKVVHAYGHAGAGYQNSIGSAKAVVRLVEDSLVKEARL
ncbi:FAD dependent oxidoreductase [Polychaeton citri CBS 116435]|uniref:FAD dependent oxidoreductase n=1 Tax=Polychaeton citri CBS 116435 TaxID=1314669 RepID=A0A9P4Q2U2_9PEZI|nr:FAD dependent oxidoreductase [Polychaeton citri CBS 116435]